MQKTYKIRCRDVLLTFLVLIYDFACSTLSLFVLFVASIQVPVLFISTDYVFDGTKPPYKENDAPNPLNKYGKSKLDGEKVVLAASKG